MPVGLDGERLELVELLERVAEIGARHGVGIVDHIEDRIVGLKVRDIYEVPAAAILLLAHAELEKLVGTIHQNQLKPTLDQRWAYLVYAGLWWEPLRTDLDAFMDAANAQVTGTIGIKLYKGSARVVTRASPERRLRRPAGDIRRVRRPVLPGRGPRVHRAVVAAVPHGVACAQRIERVRSTRMGYRLLGFAVWQGGKWYARRRLAGVRRKAAIAALSAAVLAGVIAAGKAASAPQS